MATCFRWYAYASTTRCTVFSSPKPICKDWTTPMKSAFSSGSTHSSRPPLRTATSYNANYINASRKITPRYTPSANSMNIFRLRRTITLYRYVTPTP